MHAHDHADLYVFRKSDEPLQAFGVILCSALSRQFMCTGNDGRGQIARGVAELFGTANPECIVPCHRAAMDPYEAAQWNESIPIG